MRVCDSDHLWGHGGTSSWAWKCFVRGHNTLLMDSWDPIPGRPCGEVNWAARPGYPTRDLNRRHDWTWEPVRQAIGNTRALAQRVNLAAMVPHDDLATTKYCLASPGVEYIVYLPEGDEVTVDLTGTSATFGVEWMHPVEGTITAGGSVQGGGKPFPCHSGARPHSICGGVKRACSACVCQRELNSNGGRNHVRKE